MLLRLAILPLLLVWMAMPAAAQPQAGAGTEFAASDYREDALSIERLINENYAYLERLPDGRAPLTAKLRGEAELVSDRRSLLRFAERMLLTLADHHAITGSSTAESWAVVPSYSDLWVEREDGAYVITAVRENSPAARAGLRSGDRLLAIGGAALDEAVQSFWSDLGLPVTAERAAFAARLLAAGKRNAPRLLRIQRSGQPSREVALPNLYLKDRQNAPVLLATKMGRDLVIRIDDSLGDEATIKAFDEAMSSASPGQRIILDLTNTPSGGNTVVARALMGWFVNEPVSYQVHNVPAEKRRTGIARQWVEQVLPRPGKHHSGRLLVKVGRWTGSMGEGLAIGLDAIGAEVVGTRMAGLLGAIYDYRLENSGLVIKLPAERLLAVDGTPREAFVPRRRAISR